MFNLLPKACGTARTYQASSKRRVCCEPTESMINRHRYGTCDEIRVFIILGSTFGNRTLVDQMEFNRL